MKELGDQKVAKEGEGEEWPKTGRQHRYTGARTHAQKARATRDATFARRDECLSVVNNAEVGLEFQKIVVPT